MSTVPKRWNDTVASHRIELRDAILDAMAALASERGLTAVSMSQIAERVGITRATLYKYFSDLQAVLRAWHERQIATNLAALAAARDPGHDARASLERMLGVYGRLVREQHSTELVALLHDSEHASRGYANFTATLSDVIAQGVEGGWFRDDVAPTELARYCIHALGAASGAASQDVVRRLVSVTLAGLQRPGRGGAR